MSYTASDYAAARDLVQMIVEQGEPGTHKIVCPLCAGGSSGEKSFSLSVGDGGSYSWLCHRASCGFAGHRGVGRAVLAHEPARKEFIPRPYPYETVPMDADETLGSHPRHKIVGALGGGWAHLCRLARVRARADEPEYETVWTLFDVFGQETGKISKNTAGGNKEVRTWRTAPGPVYCCYPARWFWGVDEDAPRVLWLVEDHLSALRLMSRSDPPTYAIALCGTNVSRELVNALAGLGELDKVYVALDPDASTLSLKTALWLRNECGLPAWPVLLRDDIKDMREYEIRGMMRQYA